jgi:hypothetical protein
MLRLSHGGNEDFDNQPVCLGSAKGRRRFHAARIGRTFSPSAAGAISQKRFAAAGVQSSR